MGFIACEGMKDKSLFDSHILSGQSVYIWERLIIDCCRRGPSSVAFFLS